MLYRFRLANLKLSNYRDNFFSKDVKCFEFMINLWQFFNLVFFWPIFICIKVRTFSTKNKTFLTLPFWKLLKIFIISRLKLICKYQLKYLFSVIYEKNLQNNKSAREWKTISFLFMRPTPSDAAVLFLQP